MHALEEHLAEVAGAFDLEGVRAQLANDARGAELLAALDARIAAVAGDWTADRVCQRMVPMLLAHKADLNRYAAHAAWKAANPGAVATWNEANAALQDAGAAGVRRTDH